MLLVKTFTAKSDISGTGLFADEFIPKGKIVWAFDKNVDESFSEQEVELLPEPKRSEIKSLYFAYISKETGLYINCGDDAKFTNHSPKANTGFLQSDKEEKCYALHDIEKGEEITQDYSEFGEVEFGFDIKVV